MGRPMALRLLRAGIPLVVCDPNPDTLQPFVAGGAQVADTPRDVASMAEGVLTCLPTSAVSEQVALGEHGLVHGSRICWQAETSTIGQATLACIASGMHKRGIQVLDTPVSGGPRGEASGRLSCFVASSPEAFELARPVLSVMADKLFHVGHQPGQSQVLKLANNLMNAAALTISCEMLQMTAAVGIDLGVALDVINASTGRSRATEETLPAQILSGAFHTGARLEILHKDVTLAIEQAHRLGTASVASDGVLRVWEEAAAAGYGQCDLSRIFEFIARQGERAPSSDGCRNSDAQ